MIQKRLINAFKIMVIILLMMMISLVSIIEWKGDAIAQKVIDGVENQLQDSLHFDGLHLEWFSYFPCVALRINGLTLGSNNEPFIEGGHLDIVLRLLPLFRETIIINRILLSNSKINIIKQDSRWSYEVFKKSANQSESEWNATVNLLNLKKTKLVYDDHEGLSLSMDIEKAQLDGVLTGKLFDAEIELNASLTDLVTGAYKLPEAFSFDMSGHYKHDLNAGTQEYSRWKINTAGINFEGSGSTQKEKERERIEAEISWKNGDAETLKQFIPANNIKDWKEYIISGDTEGQIGINGNSSENEVPHINCTAVLKKGSIKFPREEGQLKDVLLNLSYDNGDLKSKKNSLVRANLKKGSFQGHSLKADILIKDLDHPELDLDLQGSLPAGLLNLFSSSKIQFQSGVFDVDQLKTEGLVLKNASLKSFIEKSETDFSMRNIKFNYIDDVIGITQGSIHLDHSGQVKLSMENFTWNKANAEEVRAEFEIKSDKVDYEIKGSFCHGEVESKGNISGISQRPVIDADWRLKGVEMKEVMASFADFGQTFIASENIKGKTNIWAHSVIPFDASGNMLTHEVYIQAALDIKDGELHNMKTLEDFSKYIHLEDLHDIRFNEFRNYLKMEDGKVYLPVVFIQSNAINISVSGIHSFDQHILYNLKINAGQVAANKLRKLDPGKRFKEARKSGWINLYYVLSGTTTSVEYRQDQKEVLSGFEQSAALKENLRSYLVDHFGYDVYWLEPNEWEDIPEYK